MKKILIVDDQTDNLYLLDLLLKSKGHAVLQAINGHLALETARKEHPDLIISDILMPVMDGFSLCREVKKDVALSQRPFIFYTATYTDKKDEAYALSIGADRFIKKPMDPALFIDAVTQVIQDYEHAAPPVRKAVEMEEEESYKLYSERLIQKLEKKMLDLEEEVERRAKVELELHRSRNEWEETFQAIASPALLLDTDYNIVHANRSAMLALNKSGQDLIGKKCFEVFHHKDQPQHGCPMQTLINTGAPQSMEIEVEALGGFFLLNCAPLTNDKGEFDKIIHIAVDITERKQMEEELKQSEERFRQLVENINELFWIRDAQTQAILYISPIFEKMFGMPTSAMYKDPFTFIQAIVKEDRPIVHRSHRDQMERGKATNISYRIKRGDETRWLRSRAFPVRDDNDKVIWIAGVAEDITQAKMADKERKQLEGQLVQAQKLEAIGTLAGGIAHDFNNILSAIIGFTELAVEDVPVGSATRQNLKEVLAAGLRAKELVRQILTLARKSDDEIEPVKVQFIAKESVKLIRSTISANIEIKEEINSNAFVMASPAQMHQVFMNLLTNAAHAMKERGGVLTIDLSDIDLVKNPASDHLDLRPGPYIKAVISDSGEGIPQQYLDDIFNPYFTTKDIGEGTGLGLSISYGIIKSCGGSITAESMVGQGSTFTLFLPTTSAAAPTSPMKKKPLATGTERLLIVDDEPAITDMTIKHLERLGYTVDSSTSSLEALARFEAAPYDVDLVITDMAMPQMTGDKLAIELLRIRPDLPIILCTGFSQRMSEKVAELIGIKDFAMKPLSIEDLSNRIRMVLDSK